MDEEPEIGLPNYLDPRLDLTGSICTNANVEHHLDLSLDRSYQVCSSSFWVHSE